MDVRNSFYDLALQLVVEQPFKTPFVAAVVLVINTTKPEMVDDLLAKTAEATTSAIASGDWRGVKLYLKFLGSLQGLLEADGVFAVLQDLFTKAVELQTENNDDVSFILLFHRLAQSMTAQI